MELETVIHDVIYQLSAKRLEHGDLAHNGFAFGVSGGNLINKGPRCRDTGGKHRETLADGLFPPKRGAKGVAFFDILKR